jgi:long-chain acyl-CoA synthetase
MRTRRTDLEQALARWIGAGSRDAAEPAAALLDTAEAVLAEEGQADVASAVWHAYLEETRRSAYLLALPDRAARDRWAATTFRAIRASGYSLRTLFEQRAAAHPDRTLFEDRRDVDSPCWSYEAVARYARAIAGVFLAESPEPRVLIFSENSIDSAVADLACLTQGILVAPLNVHTDDRTLSWILDRLEIDTVVTDTDSRHARIAAATARPGRDITVFRTSGPAAATQVASLVGTPLREACARLDLDEAAARLDAREPDVLAPATVMFTSGSTGDSRGVVFSQYMLLSKRFARAAALPAVGEGEVLVSYLPLFHTFGRYLEMLGMVFWGGTYVFAGSPAAEALQSELERVGPTGLISVPVRWTQIREQCLEAMARAGDETAAGAAARDVLGGRLRWGLSAAGYLDPRVFRFFQRHGVELCSGFGMTEATGGITMTPPGAYVDGTVGIPLPGIDTRLTDEGELLISGVYVAPYLDPDGDPGSFPSLDPDVERWVRTGDLFRIRPDGHYEIVDRIKDIYKNSRGQTVAPQRVERLFADVPGIRRVFLAGDHRDHNVLLIVPDPDDPFLARRDGDEAREYFARIVASANAGLAPYERVVSFAVLDRDFEVDRGELTPKGSYRRKAIESGFAPVIEGLYAAKHLDLEVPPLVARIPRWFYRDLGVLEGDIVARPGALQNRRTGGAIRLAPGGDGRVRVGDLEYEVEGPVIDLGVFARQPRLWLGNASLVGFAPCKPGWQVPLRGVSDQVRLPRGIGRERVRARPTDRSGPEDDRLRAVHERTVAALYGPPDAALTAVDWLGRELSAADARLGAAIRRRLEALAFRRQEPIRALAYRTLLLHVPVIDYDLVFPAFLESGLTFLDEAGIEAIATAARGERRLQALRQRMHSYRTNMSWPGPPTRRRQLRRVFRMLADYARNHPADLAPVQAEFAAWALFGDDPPLARDALRLYRELAAWHEARLRTEDGTGSGDREGKVVFEFGIGRPERERLDAVLSDPTFLRHSISHAFGDDGFSWDRVPTGGVWISPQLSHRRLPLYRLGLNLDDGRHFDLLLALGPGLRTTESRDTVLWLTALSDVPFGTPVLPRFGAWRRDLGAFSLAYVSDLTAWERIRELATRRDVVRGDPVPAALRPLFVRGMAAFFHAWEQSGGRIVPGAIAPANVAVPDADFHERTHILSLAGWRSYQGPLDLIRPMVRAFYRLVAAHYPHLREGLRHSWIFDAAIEALGEDAGSRFLEALDAALADAAGAGPAFDPAGLRSELHGYRRAFAAGRHVPLPVLCAIDRYRAWERMNPTATADAREESVTHMIRLYRLDRFPDAYRYHVYRSTYFARAGGEVDAAFERLVRRGLEDRGRSGHLRELSTLQGLIREPRDRDVFSRMVFPRSAPAQRLEVLALNGDQSKRVVVRSEVRDRRGTPYTVRDPLTPVEVGQLYRLVLEAGYRMEVAEDARQLVITDAEDRVVGGLSYRWEEGGVAAIDAIVVARALTSRGLGGGLVEDFAVRMAAEGARILRTNFCLAGLFTKHGFRVDQRWGGLIRPVA